MPSRLVTAAILLFWLSMTGWLIQREVVPMMIADASPTYQIDLTDEIGSSLVGWDVLSDGKRIGTATSKIIVGEDRSFEFRCNYHFDKLRIGPAGFRGADSGFRVSEDGKLLSISAKIVMNDMTLELKGDAVNNMLEPHMFRDGAEWKFIDFGKVDLARQGSVVNPMHLMPRLRGLRAGQVWAIHRFDPFSGMDNPLVKQFGKQGAAVPKLIAEVKNDVLHWNRKEVLCYKIEYHEPGKDEVTARTWVRRLDGLVLQQEASFGIEVIAFNVKMLAQRIPD